VLKWTLANEADLLVVLVYSAAVFSSITYVDQLLQRLKEVRACVCVWAETLHYARRCGHLALHKPPS
jgi:hypothetical protein